MHAPLSSLVHSGCYVAVTPNMASLGGHFEWARLPGALRAVALKPPGSNSLHVEMMLACLHLLS